MLSTHAIVRINPDLSMLKDQNTGRFVGVLDPTGERDTVWLNQEDAFLGVGTRRYVDFRTAANGGMGSNTNDGRSWATAYATMAFALAACSNYDTICYVGRCTESGLTSTLVGIQIIGGGPHSGSQCIWKPAADAVGITVHGKGWLFANFKAEPYPAQALILAERNTAGTLDGSDMSIIGVEQNAGGLLLDAISVRQMTILGVHGHDAGVAVIRCSDISHGEALRWKISGCRFMNNANHVIAKLTDSEISHNLFQAVGLSYTATTKLDTSGGDGRNIVTKNVMTGTYSVAGGYSDHANDYWYDNDISTGKTSTNPA